MTRWLRRLLARIYLELLRRLLGLPPLSRALPEGEARELVDGIAERRLSRFQGAQSLFLSRAFPGRKHQIHEVLYDFETIYPADAFAPLISPDPYLTHQFNELVNPRKWLDPEWYAILQSLEVAPLQLERMHRKAYEWTQTLYALQKLGALREDARCLDVGAGHEVILYWLANRMGEVVATDLYGADWAEAGAQEGDPDVLEAPERFAPFSYRQDRLKFLRMDGRKLEFPDSSFDCVVSLSSIEHFGGVDGAVASLREMGRVCRPQGLVAIATELILNDAQHPEFFTLDELRKLIAASGLKLIQAPTFELPRVVRANPLVLPDEFYKTPMLAINDQGVQFTSVFLVLRKE